MSLTGEERPAPRVTVCVPTVGRETLWLRAIPSILAAATDPVDIVVIGSASPQTGELPDPASTVVIAPAADDASPGSKRNIGAELATGEVLVFLDDDDELAQGSVTALVEPFADVDVDFVSGLCVAIDGDGVQVETVRPSPLGPLFGDLVGVYLAGGFAVRRSLFEEVGGYHEDLWFGENSDLAMRLGQEIRRRGHRAVALDQVVAFHHRSGRSYLDVGGASAEHVLACQSEVLDEHRELRSEWHGIAGVWALRDGRQQDARRHFWQAIADAPTSLTGWYRGALSLAPSLARRRWDRGRP